MGILRTWCENRRGRKKLSQSVKEFREKVKTYANLTPPDIPNIVNDELALAVSSWVDAKVKANGGWDNQLKIVSSLPKPCQYVYATNLAINEIYNGGLNQFYFNSSGQYADIVVEGFAAIGASKLEDYMRQANGIFADNKATLEKYNDESVESFSASYKEKLFDALDTLMQEELDTHFFSEVQCPTYIREHGECFGDVL